MKIKFNTDDNLPLNKSLKLYLLTIIVRCIFEEDGKLYQQLYLDDLENDRIEGIDVNKTNASKKCGICHYWYFKDICFKYESYLSNGCYNLIQKALSFNDVAIAFVKGLQKCLQNSLLVYEQRWYN